MIMLHITFKSNQEHSFLEAFSAASINNQ